MVEIDASASRRVGALCSAASAFFADATDAMQRSFLACVLRTTTFRPREAVAKEGDECAGAWMVMEGEAHAMAKLVGGDERWVAGYWPGSGFGFNSLVWGTAPTSRG